MPPLDEGSILDMPVTVPRASVTQATDDLKARDALLRRFPEVEMVVGKAGRADTPTDPSPLDMVESIITLRPKEHWPKRTLDYKDATKQMAVVLAALQERHLIDPSGRGEPSPDPTMNAAMRLMNNGELVLQRFLISSQTWDRSCRSSSSVGQLWPQRRFRGRRHSSGAQLQRRSP
jgi:Cu(I)/Ag(I) efflux system membrane protein CusA/SilA